MKKSTIFATALTVVTLALGVGTFYSSSSSSNITKADEAEYTITIDKDTPYENGVFTITSSRGTVFHIDSYGISKDENGVFSMDTASALTNREILNGLLGIKIYGANGVVKQRTKVDNSSSWSNYSYTSDVSLEPTEFTTIDFSSVKPGYIELGTDEVYNLKFNKLTFCYTCSVSDEIAIIANFSNSVVDNFVTPSYQNLFGKLGQELNSVHLVGAEFDAGNVTMQIKSADQISNVVVTYTDSTLQSSSVIVEGKNEASVSFTFEGKRFCCPSTYVTGYDHYGCESYRDYFGIIGSSKIHIKDTNDIPEELSTLKAYPKYFTVYSATNEILLTNSSTTVKYISASELSNITYSRENPFTQTGQTTLTADFEGKSCTVGFMIYDPEVNNIEYIDCPTFTVQFNSNVSDFIQTISSKEIVIHYFEDSYSLPHKVMMDPDNIITSLVTFNRLGYSAAIQYRYETIVEYLTVQVVVEDGQPTKTYACAEEEGYIERGTSHISQIILYDNGCLKVTGTDVDNDYHSYEMDGTTMIIHYSDDLMKDLKVVINEEELKFTKYVSTATLLYFLMADFSVLGAPPGYNMPVWLYDNGVMYMNPNGENSLDEAVEGTYEFDPDDPTAIVFTFNVMGTSMSGIGVIDFDENTMMVYEPIS